MILLAFFFPVAVYLLVLGGINRRRFPLMVSGVWDFIGILFAASGFLLLGGPAILSSFKEGSWLFWLLGKTAPGQTSPESIWQVWLFFSVLYFALVVAGAGVILWRQRQLTSIYNAEPRLLERCLHRIFERLRLNPVRSGNLYLFGLASEPPASIRGTSPEGIQAPHYLTASSRGDMAGLLASAGTSQSAATDFVGQTAILELETFAALRHVTLRWDPVDNLFRQEIESQLKQVLSETPVEESDVGNWLLVIGLGLMAALFLGGLVVLLLRLSLLYR